MESLKNITPKKLNLTEIYSLYLLLGKGLGKQYLLDEIIQMLKTLPPENVKKSLHLMYDTVSLDNPMMVGLMFVRGLKANKFFEFQMFMETINGRSK